VLLALLPPLVVLAACDRNAGAGEPAGPPAVVALREGWHLRSSADVTATGAEISQPGFATAGWTAATLPSTVLGALVKSGEYPDPYHGRNLEKIPTDRFAVPWWYRTELRVEEPLAASARLVFRGVNYSAEVWLNGERIAGREQIVGAFRNFDLDVTGKLRAGANALAVQVFPPQPGDFTVGFVDWNPEPPDRSMGLWRDVELRRSGPVSLENVFVTSDFDTANPVSAALTLEAEVVNHGDVPQHAQLGVQVEGGPRGDYRVQLAAGERKRLRLTPAELPALQVANPRLWWPNNLGEPNLYRFDLTVAAGDGTPSDRQSIQLGIRKVADYLDDKGQRGYRINGRDVLVRGGGWVDDLLLADDERRIEDQIRYAKHLNLNTIRLEGFWGTTDAIYELADRHGLMVWVGWSCQWEWDTYLGAPVDDFGGVDTPAEMELVTVSLADQVRWLRNHPSIVVWNLASDMLPRAELERRYRNLLAEVDPTRPPLGACSVRTSEVSGPTGVKMNGPYEWVPPEYWYVDRTRGGAFGFNTETGPGAQPPVIDSLKRMLPEENWWPMDDMWDYHAGRHQFSNLDRYTAALDARYGPSQSLEEFAQKAQLANYEAMRPMFEAFSLRRPDAKGVIQWMLNSAWPDTFWQLYDWYLAPNGAYYAARNANRPLNVAYDYGERKVVAVNDTGEPLRGRAVVRLLDTNSRVVSETTVPLELAAGERREVHALAPFPPGSAVYFLDARLEQQGGELLAHSFYWLPVRADEPDWDKSEWFYTPTRRYADLTAVTKLSPATLAVSHRFTPGADGHDVEVTLHNQGEGLAFFVELAVVGATSGRLATPVLWDDNYVSLLPGERRTLRGSVPAHALAGEQPAFRYQGMNVAAGR
jgi:exo-1,4-beta-D-glucosaminidase